MFKRGDPKSTVGGQMLVYSVFLFIIPSINTSSHHSSKMKLQAFLFFPSQLNTEVEHSSNC